MDIKGYRFFPSLMKVLPLRWQRVFEDSRVMRSLLNKVNLIAADGLTKELGIASFLFAKRVFRLAPKSGLRHTALYLKQCSACLQTAYGGELAPKSLLPVPVSLRRSGYPRIIPSFIRQKMDRKRDRFDLLVKV
jgi:hypothetical protein